MGPRPASRGRRTVGAAMISLSRGALCRTALGAALLLSLGACQTVPPVPRPPLYSSIESARDFGYADRKLSGSTYEVTYIGPSDTVPSETLAREARVKADNAIAEDMALWRSADLAVEKGYPAFRITDRHSETQITVRNDDYYYDPYYYGSFGYYGYYGPYYHPYGYYDSGYGRSSQAQVKVVLTIDLVRKMGKGAIDADAVRARMAQKYPDARRATGGGKPGKRHDSGTPESGKAG